MFACLWRRSLCLHRFSGLCVCYNTAGVIACAVCCQLLIIQACRCDMHQCVSTRAYLLLSLCLFASCCSVAELLCCYSDMTVASAYAPDERRTSDQNKTKTAAIFFILYSLFPILRPLTGAIYISGANLFWQWNGAGIAVCCHDKVRVLPLTWRPKWQGFGVRFGRVIPAP